MLPENLTDGVLASPKWSLTSFTRIRPLAADAISRLHRTGELGNPIDDDLHFMSVNSSLKDRRKGGYEPKEAITECDDSGTHATTLELPSICPIMASWAGTTKPTLNERFTKQAKNAFCRQVIGTVVTPCSFFSYDCHGYLRILVPTAFTRQWCHISCGTKHASTTPSLLCRLSETGGMSRRALLAQHYDRLALLIT